MNGTRNARHHGRGDIAITGLIRPGGVKNGIGPAKKEIFAKIRKFEAGKPDYGPAAGAGASSGRKPEKTAGLPEAAENRP